MSPNRPARVACAFFAFLAIAPAAAAQDDDAARTEVAPHDHDAAPAGAVVDAPPEDEVDESDTSPRRRWTDGPRRVPVPHGAARDRARRLGLGTREAAHELLRQGPRPAWRAAAGRAPSDLRWPVDIGALGRGFGYVRHDRPEVRHNGVDIATPRGMVIRAAADGIVAYSDNELRGYGNCVIVVHANGWVTLYAHADRTTVQPGWRVRRGERIGFVGSTGRSDGPHLHFELHGEDGGAMNPLPHFEGEPWVEGRERLLALRRRGGGHTYDHLGELAPDFGADPPSRAAPGRTPAAPAPRDESPREPAVPVELTRLLERGPTRAERLSLRDQRTTAYEPPIRVEAAATYADGRLHYEAPLATNVRAPRSGRVVFAGSGLREARTSVVLLHEDGLVSVLSAEMDLTVESGALVATGDRVGIVRSTSGLDLELLRRGRALDATTLFTVPPPVATADEPPRGAPSRGPAAEPNRCVDGRSRSTREPC